MSAFLVTNTTIDKVVSWCKGGLSNYGHGESVENQELFGRKLQELNLKSVLYRYPEEKLRRPPYEWTGKNYSLYEIHKAISCLIYQMSEGEEVPNTPEYKYLQEQENIILYRIVSELPKWKNAAWE